jgi:hypothetical protein
MYPAHPLRHLLRHPLSALAGALLAAGVALPAQAVAVPASLAPAAYENLTLHIAARGVQIYECRRAADGAAWTFVAPQAELFDHDGRRIGWHGAGPRWRFADGSSVTGRVKARADAPQPRAIPWLLLEARARRPHDRLGRVRSVQRINTAGGQAPADGCDATTVGNALRVPYTADYLFYGSR